MLQKVRISKSINASVEIDKDLAKYYVLPSYMLLLLEQHTEFRAAFKLMNEKFDLSLLQKVFDEEATKCSPPTTV